MSKNPRYNVNLIFSIFIGIFFSELFMAEAKAVLYELQRKRYISFATAANTGIILKVIALVIFCVTVFIFSTKKIKRINLNRIGIYLILSVIVSIIISFAVVFGVMMITAKLVPDIEKYFIDNYFLAINASFIILFSGVIIFLLIYSAFINRKVKYIKFLTDKVKIIKQEGFGKTIEVKGEDELSELCMSINDMSVELRNKIDNEKRIETNKSELITNVSHDLRTPLTSIIGYVDLLKRNGFSDREKFNDYIEIIDERSKSLNKLIDELFEYTKLSSHDIQLNYSEVEFGSLVSQIAGEYEVMFEREGLELEKYIDDREIFITADVEKIVRAVENLFTNARKYSVKNSKVVLRVYEENFKAVFVISNKVENMKDEDIENIFERFYKGDKSRNRQDSSGLGLSIVKKIVELHNGEVRVELNDDIIEFKVLIPCSGISVNYL